MPRRDDVDDEDTEDDPTPPPSKSDAEAETKIKKWLADVLDEREAAGKPAKRVPAVRRRTESKKSGVWNSLFGG